MRSERRIRKVRDIGLGGAWNSALLLLPFLSFRYPDVTYTLVDGKDYRVDQMDHEFFMRLGNKAEVQAEDARQRFPGMKIIAVPKFLAKETSKTMIAARELIEERDVVLLKVDNSETKKLVLNHCTALRDTTLLMGGVDGTHANVQVYLRRDGQDITPSPAEKYAEIRDAADELPEEIQRYAAGTSGDCLRDALKENKEERPNYFALLTATQLILNALWLVIDLEEKGQIHNFPYFESWIDISKAKAVPSLCGKEVCS